MAAILVLFAVVFVLVPAVHVVGDEIELSIDCGLPDIYGPSTDPETKNYYVPDGSYVDAAGENHVVAAAGNKAGRVPPIQSLRSFPSGEWNCYALSTQAQTTYMVRAQFAYGNYDGKSSSSVQFELHLGSNLWDIITVTTDESIVTKEAVFVAWAGWAPVCLMNTGGGTPFVSVVELRRLGGLYPPVSSNRWMSMYARRKMGTDISLTRHPDDPHDRTWSGMTSTQWVNLTLPTQDVIQPDSRFDVPSTVLRTAVAAAAAASNTSITVVVPNNKGYISTDQYMVFLHFADFQSTQIRQFNIYVNDQQPWLSPVKPYSLHYDVAFCVYSSEPYSSSDGKHNVTLVPTATSELPPMLNALEIYTLIDLDDASSTFPADFNAIMGIKFEYGVKKNWMGDPCFPSSLWNGVECRNISDYWRITSIDLSSSNLSGAISQNFTFLKALENLDLSYNNLNGIIPDSLPSLPSLRALNLSGNDLTGPFPDSLCKNKTGLVFSYEPGGPRCYKESNPSGKRATVLAVSVVVPVLVVAVLVLGYFIRRKKIVPNVSTNDDRAGEPEFENVPRSAKIHGDHLQDSENRAFTYKELEKITDNFQRFVGHGGFGHVYYGRLENGTEVAVRKRSESSLHELDEFVAEVQSLTKVHHRNLVSLVGYCWEEDHLALVYEYLSQGSLFDHLRGKNSVAQTMNWETRVRVVLEAAQGLDYLHNGCNLPIIHRDVKTSNILLNRNLEAKLADFGLCKTYLSDSQTHISATAAGSAGYIDPEYHTGRLTESSDVYSFGVVLLEIATGKPPILPGHGHIVQRVNEMITAGDDIGSIADVRLEGAYDVNSMWKVVDTASKCTSDAAAQRPTMATVVAQLKESLALEEGRERDSSSVRATLGGDISALLSTVGPSAR